jgi:hypothetical protein|tara:strand:+ start:741 stop:953 length:213 start_codon:yes stop_codon:yes gene_type:complete
MNFGETLLAYWPIITAAMAMVWWFSRAISNLENKNDRMDERMNDAEDKLTTIFSLYNNLISRMLDERKPK